MIHFRCLSLKCRDVNLIPMFYIQDMETLDLFQIGVWGNTKYHLLSLLYILYYYGFVYTHIRAAMITCPIVSYFLVLFFALVAYYWYIYIYAVLVGNISDKWLNRKESHTCTYNTDIISSPDSCVKIGFWPVLGVFVNTNKKSNQEADRLGDWTYCLHKPERIVTIKPVR